MTDEALWAVTTRSQWMVMTLSERKVPRTKSGRRKLRLFACACCHLVRELLPTDRFRQAIDLAEAFADGRVSSQDLKAVRDDLDVAHDAFDPTYSSVDGVYAATMALEVTNPKASDAALGMTTCGRPLAGCIKIEKEANAYMCHLLRDIFGNPFQSVAFPKSWRTEHTVGLALKMYDGRDFRAMPILADALEEAGCDNADILSHCREPGVHVRGCWVVDLVLGKT